MLLLAAALLSGAGLPPGQVINRVEAAAAPSHTYALYLPSGYTQDRAWPVMYCFDPRARGRVPVELFAAEAEKYGYILAGSNNSRNGAFRDSVAAIQAMWNDTHARFNIDEHRVYAAGFSGGARVATWMAQNVNGVTGVLVSGGGFMSRPETVPFALFGCAGTDDFNWPELKEIDTVLDRLGTPHRVVVFEGGHSWPPAAIAARAFEWFELHAMRSGLRSRDARLVAASLQARLAAIESAPPAEQWVELSAIAADFAGLEDVSGYERRASELRSSAAVKQFLKIEKREMARNRELSVELQQAMREPDDFAERQIAAGRLHSLVRRLRTQAEARGDSSDRRIARRVLGNVAIGLIENGREQVEDKRLDAAVRNLTLATEMQPQWASAWYELARAHALNRNPKRAMEALRKAVDGGFRDESAIGSEPAFKELRGAQGFSEILARVK